LVLKEGLNYSCAKHKGRAHTNGNWNQESPWQRGESSARNFARSFTGGKADQLANAENEVGDRVDECLVDPNDQSEGSAAHAWDYLCCAHERAATNIGQEF
jgi:hypothetical protein